MKNPKTSVAVVKKIDEANAGSACKAFNATGITNPKTQKLQDFQS